MDEPLNAMESALLQVFREQGGVGIPVPTEVLAANAYTRGGSGPMFSGSIETALLNLQFRGLIAPGPDPYGAMTYVLTLSGAAVIRTTRQSR